MFHRLAAAGPARSAAQFRAASLPSTVYPNLAWKRQYHASRASSTSRPTVGLVFGPLVIRPIPVPIPIPPRPSHLTPDLLSRPYATTKPDKPLEKVIKAAAEATPPEEVSATSSIRPLIEPSRPKQALETDQTSYSMSRALLSDIHAVQETFALKEVPRDAYTLGFLGTVPYLSTSLAALFCAWDLNYAKAHGAGWYMTPEAADATIVWLENLQIGYGAVILSFLGAIHWGLEFSRYGNTSSRTRYLLGLGASLVAWPTVLLPYEYALGAQFLGFTGMYFADARLSSAGLAPPWYGTYRFILTLVVGMSIIISLIGRGQVEVAKSGSKRNLAKTGREEGKERGRRFEAEKAKAWDQKKKQDEEQKKRELEEQMRRRLKENARPVKKDVED